jgi:hypothetical protein
MRKIYLLVAAVCLCTAFYFIYPQFKNKESLITTFEEEGKDEYENPYERDLLEIEKTRDPSLDYVPVERLGVAMDYTESLKVLARGTRTTMDMNWEERGPIYDSLGPSNGNTRAGVNYTSGRIRAVLVDTLNDPTGNTVYTGGVAGGLWRCTNFLSEIPNWQVINDYFSNMAISSITQDPTKPNVMYFSTGEAANNADAVFGKGVWKSTDGGLSWSHLPSTTRLIRNFKILCDAAGNIYLASRTLTTPIEQPYGLLRSKDGGNTWQDITPTGLTSNNICTDIELSTTGRFHASFGYVSGGIGSVSHRYTDDPANVTNSSGWNSSFGIRRLGTPGANRLELATYGDIVYGITTNTSNNIDSSYKSVDGGATFTKQNTTAYTASLTNTQGWYNITLAINPSNPSQIMMGGLDAYRSNNDGATITRATAWVTVAPYVHADHHFMQWWNIGGENRILIGCDGGLFLTRNGGSTWRDKNRNLGIKQFYAGAIHPDAGSPYLLAGAQDNGVHQIKYPGLTSSIEVTGGDGCFVHINQKNPLIQFGSYTNSQYRRSINGGQTWSQANFSSATGLFVNPFDYDDERNTMYASNGVSNAPNLQIRRWINAHTSNTSTLLAVPKLIRNGANSNATSFKVSPHTANRVFIGGSTGKLIRLDNANTVSAADMEANTADITGASFPSGFLNCVNVGTSDNFLVAVFTNYGVNNVWYSSNGGEAWSPIDGNLPDMPVRWAIFHPQYNNRLIIATEAGVYTTEAVNGTNTIWRVSAGFPTVRTDMLKLRTSDNTIVAATHGRGLYTAVVPTTTTPEINFATEALTVTEQTASSMGCRGYRDYNVDLDIFNAPTGDATVTINVAGGNTAVRGVDFDFTTNGDFSNPSDQVVFANGVKEKKTIVLRIYDDAEVENTEAFTFSYIISGTTNAEEGSIRTFDMTIKDNDHAPIAVPTIQEYSVGTFTSNVSTHAPFASNKIKHRMQSLYTAAELKAAGVYRDGSIRSLTINVIDKNSTRPFKGFTISLANTPATALTNYTNVPFTPVYSADYSSVRGANVFQFTTPFVWDGVSNVAVQFCFDNESGPVDALPDYMEGNSYPLGAGVRATVYANHTTQPLAGCALPAAFVSDFRINATFGFDFGINTIATALNTAKTEYLTSNNDLYYYSPAGQIIARIRNLSGHNYGCTQVKIDRAGTGATKFWNSNKKNFLMDKTFQVIPENNNPSGSYEVTFYYTKAEKEGWEAATKNTWDEVLLVKVKDRISDVTASNAQPNNDGSVQSVLVPVHGTYGDGYTLTAVFENGFGGFGAGDPGRQFNNLIVKAQATERAGAPDDINVKWTTSSELKSSHFEIEKSYDGINFRKIGTVQSVGNSRSVSQYSFTDHEKVELNYYRIKMVWSDKTSMISNSVLVRNSKVAAQEMFVLGNPFSTSLKVRFAKVPTGAVAMNLYDAQGRLVASKRTTPGETAVFDLGHVKMSTGVYHLDVLVDGVHYKARVLKDR